MNTKVPSTGLTVPGSRSETVRAVRMHLLDGKRPEDIPDLLGLQWGSILRNLKRAASRAERAKDARALQIINALLDCMCRPFAGMEPDEVVRRRAEGLDALRDTAAVAA